MLLSSSTYRTTLAQQDRPNRKEQVVAGGLDYFQEHLRLLGAVGSATVEFDYGCPETDPNDPLRFVCLNPAPEETFFDVRDLGQITLPGNSAKNFIFDIANYTVRYEFENGTGSPQPSAIFVFEPYLTIESDALKDPRAVDSSGDPLNGRLDYVFEAGIYRRDRTMGIGERDFQDLRYTRVQAEGLSKRMFVSLDIPADIVDKMFRMPMTIRLNFRGNARLLSNHRSHNRINYSVRLLGN